MSRPAELVTAGLIAASGISAMIWWPDVSDEVALSPRGDTHSAERRVDPGEPRTPASPPDRTAAPEPVRRAAPGMPQAYPDIRFPLESAPAWINSVNHGIGGFYGPPGASCASGNFARPHLDSFCEPGGDGAPICPAGHAHTGQDIRPATCDAASYWAVAVDDGVITSIGAYSVRLLADDGRRYTYLHLDPGSLVQEAGERVVRGDRLGMVSNAFGGTPAAIHLHFEMRAVVELEDGTLLPVPVSPFRPLTEAYFDLVEGRENREGA